MRILILAAGYGTRLYPLTIDTPKAFIAVEGRPLIDRIVDKISVLRDEFPIEEVVVVSNDKFYRVFCDWEQKQKIAITVLNDGSLSPEDRLGAIGDIWFAINNRLDEDWFVLGSDNFFDWGLSEFLSFAGAKRPYPSVGVYVLKDKDEAKNFGVVTLDGDSKITNFVEKPGNPKANTIATCIYFFPQGSLHYLQTFLRETEKVDAAGKYLEWLVEKTCVYGYSFTGTWVDIGSKYRDNFDRIEE